MSCCCFAESLLKSVFNVGDRLLIKSLRSVIYFWTMKDEMTSGFVAIPTKKKKNGECLLNREEVSIEVRHLHPETGV